MKQCIRCGNHKPEVEFYEHPRMADGRLNKCKVCCRADALLNRRSRLEHYRQYDRELFSTLRRQETVHSHQKRHRSVNPEKYRARTAVGNAIRAGRLVRGPCEVCGNAASEETAAAMQSATGLIQCGMVSEDEVVTLPVASLVGEDRWHLSSK